MIPGTIPVLQTKSWQEQLIELITDPKELLLALKLDPSLLPAAGHASDLFPLRVPHAYLNRIKKGNIRDPLLMQVLPLGAELNAQEGYVNDPLAEAETNPAPGIIHKYQGRVLLIAASQCAINCRYCFRRAFPYNDHTLSRQEWLGSLDYIARDDSISEVILSGGDPLSVGDKQLDWLITAIAEIPHVKRLRLHTRLPIVLPDRMTDHLVQMLSASRLKTVIVVHCNHAQELGPDMRCRFSQFRANGITLLNQSVLLKGVNDDPHTLCNLSETLFDYGVIPYYLHTLDKVTGSAHFHIPDARAVSLHREMSHTLPGYLVPKLVKEEAHMKAKTWINQGAT